MRSDLVFLAEQYVPNRFLLCHWVRVASRRFHKNGEPIQETISKVLAMAAHSSIGPEAGRRVVGAVLVPNMPSRPRVVGTLPGNGFAEEQMRNVG